MLGAGFRQALECPAKEFGLYCAQNEIIESF